MPWVADETTELERETIDNLIYLSLVDTALLKSALELSWVQDEITEAESVGIERLYGLSYADVSLATKAIALDWVQDGITEIESDVIKYLDWTAFHDAEAVASIVAMPFLESLEEDDLLAIRGIYELASDEDDDLLEAMLEHPTVADGITDAHTTLVTAASTLGGPEEIERMLTPGYATIETVPSSTMLTPQLKISIARTGSQSQPWTAAGISEAVEFIENIMQVPLPTSHVIVVLNDKAFNANYGGTNFGFAFSLHPEGELPRGSSDGHYFQSGIVHETAHYYWRASADWIDEGIANIFEYMYGIESGIGSGLLEKPRRENCEAHDLEMLTERDPEQEDVDQFRCNYYLGQSLFLELLENLETNEFNERLRELYRLSLKAKDAGNAPGIAEVRQAFHGQSEIVEKHWSGKLNAPENRPFDEGIYRVSHDLIQWNQYPTYHGDSVMFSGTLLNGAVLSLRTLTEGKENGVTQNFDLYPSDGYEFAGWILPHPRTWNRLYPGTSTATEYRLEGNTFTVKFPFNSALGDPSEYVVNVWGFRDESRVPFIGETIDLLGYARIRVE